MIIFLYWLIEEKLTERKILPDNGNGIKKIQIYTPIGKFIREIDFANEKNFLGISSFTINKEKNILFALIHFRSENGKDTTAVYIYDLVTNVILHTHNLNLPFKIYTRLTYNNINEQIVISDYDNNCIDLVLIPITNEEKLLVKSFSCKGKDDGQVDHPLGITTQGSNIYVVDNGNNRIQKFSLL